MMLRVVSLFCGLGGADAGLYAAADELGIDLEVVDAIDSWGVAVAVYNANARHPVARVADVKTLTRADLPPHDLVIGGPPCQPFSIAGKKLGHADPRNCLPDFIRLAGIGCADEVPWLMENVKSGLINAPFVTKLCAADFGDVTSRKRWFYSNYFLHVVATPSGRRIRDIRDHDEDARILAKRSGCKAGAHEHYGADELLRSETAHAWHGHDVRNGKLLPISEDGIFATLTSSPHGGISGGGKGHPNRVGIMVRTGKTGNDARELEDESLMPSLTAKSNNNCNMSAAKLRLALRGNSASASASASAFDDDAVLGSVLANSFHANEASKLIACRNPSLLEMARAHSIPDAWDWAGVNKTQRGQLIANSWPFGLSKAVGKALLEAIR